jgi:hypothetical protein
MLSAIGILILGNSLFIHSHVSEIGTVHIHSHPFKKNSDKDSQSHQHSDLELILIDSYSNYEGDNPLDIVSVTIEISPQKLQYEFSAIASNKVDFYLGRAPPTLF